MARIDDANAGGHEHDAELDMEHDHDHDDLQACIEECLNCHIACTTTAQYCLAQGGRHADADHVGLLLDCAEMCQTSAMMMARNSSFHARHCALCADVCKACEESCEQFGADAQMKACADACRTCHEACREMGAMS